MSQKHAAHVPFTTHTVTSSDGTTIGYRRYGRAPGVILVHGGMTAAQDLHELASALSAGFTVCVPDLRGRGLSGPFTDEHSIQKEVEDLHAVLADTGARSVFGLSSGAVVARTKDQLESFRGLEARILLMRGTKSPRTLQAPIDALHALLPHAEYSVLQGTGHLTPANGEKPHAVARRLDQFFRGRRVVGLELGSTP